MHRGKWAQCFTGLFLLMLISTILPLLPLSSSPIDASQPLKKSVPAKYTYISYVCADNNLGTYGNSDVNEMELGYDDLVTDVHVLSLLDLLSGDSVAYYISHDTDSNTITSTVLAGTGLPSEANMGNPNTLVTWVNFCMTNYPADHYILDLWDHGSGWEICIDETSGNDALTMAELRDALATINASTGNKIDILAMDACLMGTLEVAYELRDYASILVASEDAILAAGFPYDTVIADLCADPTQNTTEFASTIVDLFHAAQFPFFASCLAAVNLTLVGSSIATNFATFAQNLHSYLDLGIKNELYNARSDSENFYDPDFIDMYDFAQNTKNEAGNLTIRQNAQDLMDNISAAIINEHQYQNPGAYGLSIYFPRLQSQYSSAYTTHFSLSNDSMWDEFLVKYYTTANFGLDLRYYELDDSIGNNNNTPDPGETVQVNIELENVGDINAEFVNGTFFCSDTANVTIIDGFKSYGNLNPSDTVTRTFTFNISGSCVTGQILPLGITTISKFDTYTITRNFTFEFVVGREITIGGATLLTATEISFGTIYGNLPGPGTEEESWLKLSCSADQYLTLNLTGPLLTDFDAYVYGPDEDLVSVAGKATYPDICSILLSQSGFYYIKLLACGSGSGYYEMLVNITSSAYEDGLFYGTAFTLPGNCTVTGSLPGPNSSQYIYYRVIMDSGQVLRVSLDGDLGTDFDVYCYTPNLEEVSRSTSPDSSEECVFRSSSAGYYYIVLSRYSGSGDFTLDLEIDDYIFPIWLLILIIIIIAAIVLLGIAFYRSQQRKAQEHIHTDFFVPELDAF